jgi:inorganic pyrophosphatase
MGDLAGEAGENGIQVDVAASNRRDRTLGHIDPKARGVAEAVDDAEQDIKLLAARIGEDDRIVGVEAKTKRSFPDRQRV